MTHVQVSWLTEGKQQTGLHQRTMPLEPGLAVWRYAPARSPGGYWLLRIHIRSPSCRCLHGALLSPACALLANPATDKKDD